MKKTSPEEGGALLMALVTLGLAFACASSLRAQSGSAPSDREIDVDLYHRSIGTITITALLDGQKLYVQPQDIFSFVHIRCDASPDGLAGYYIEEVRKYQFDNVRRRVRYQDTTWNLTDQEYIVRSTGGYLRSDLFEKIFHLKCDFDFRGMAVEILSGEPLPAESEVANAKNRKDIQSSSQDIIPDRTFPLVRHLASLGVVDYSAGGNYSAQQKSGTYTLLAGGQFLGGDFDASISGVDHQHIEWSKVPWQWRESIQNSDLLSQILIGRQDPLFTTMHFPDSMIGFQISNAYAGYRSSFTNYTISDHTQPDWTVELYINNQLVNYTKADQTGYYKFVVPLSYGSTDMKLKFYGPYGEVRTSTIQLRIPYTFLPPGHLEYTLTGGTSIEHPGLNSSTAQLDMKLGISTAMTLNGGVRYLRDLEGAPVFTPYGATSLRLTSGMLVGGEYYYRYGYRSSLSIAAPLGLSLDALYDHPLTEIHSPGQSTNSGRSPSNFAAGDQFTILEQRKLTLTAPIPLVSGSLRAFATDNPTSTTDGNVSFSAEALLDIFGTSANLAVDRSFVRHTFALYGYGDMQGTVGFSLPSVLGVSCRPQFSVDYTTRTASSVQVTMSRAFGEAGSLNVNLTHAFGLVNNNSIQASFRTSLPFAAVGIASGTSTGQQPNASTTISGSLGFDPSTGALLGSSRSQVRRGGFVVVPFIDRNSNGRRDPDEPIIKQFKLEQAQGHAVEESDGMIRVSDMEPYQRYVIKTSTESLDNIALMPSFNTFAVTPPANGYARIEIPLAVGGQIEGYAMRSTPTGEQPLGGLRFKIRRAGGQDTGLVKLTDDLLSYSTGEFFYMGLPGGKYRIYPDESQLRILGCISTPAYIDFEVRNLDEGDVVESLNFTIRQASEPMSRPAVSVK